MAVDQAVSGGGEAPVPGGRSLSRRSLIAAGIAAAGLAAAGPAEAARRLVRERSLYIANPHTGESFRDVYWANGKPDRQAVRRINWLMRDFRTDIIHPIDPDLIDLLYGIQSRFGGSRRPIYLLSGYRSPQTNTMLIEEGHGAVDNSQHLYGKAADIHVGGARLGDVRKAAMSFRAGGVGTYWHNGFVHVDTGRVRYW
jgi:uncharacterized protein YcbK (DUF882 family)